MTQITTIEELIDCVRNICKAQRGRYKYSSEEYLRALWIVVKKYQNEQKVTGNLLAQVISEAFEAEPPEFDEQWLAYEQEYFDWKGDDNGYLQAIGCDYDATNTTYVIKQGLSHFDLLQDVIGYQVAELYRRRNNLLPKSPKAQRDRIYWGIYPSPGPCFHLCSGVSQMGELRPYRKMAECDWGDLAILLEFGRKALD